MKLDKQTIEKLLIEESDKIELFKTNKKSDVWVNFREIKFENVIQDYVVCKNCKELYSFKNNSTTTLKTHKCAITKFEKIDNIFKKSILNQSTFTQIKKEVTEKAINFCCNDIRAFNVIEGEGFKDLAQKYCQRF